MVALETPIARTGWKAADFTLKGTDSVMHSLDSLKGENGTVIMFICNHCPYVQKQLDRMKALTDELKPLGVNVIAINSNDDMEYPEDSFDGMRLLVHNEKITFHYLHDDTQEVAKAYGAVCTPDIFGFNAALELQYRGRLDESWSGVLDDPKRELFEAMQEVAATGSTTKEQNPSIGCSIKWRRASTQAVG